jgi:hypothetical protein
MSPQVVDSTFSAYGQATGSSFLTCGKWLAVAF